MTENRIAFISRDAIIHELGGSTTAANNLLAVLREQGAAITVTITLARSRSPRLFFRYKVPVPEAVTYRVPGYLGLGPWFLNPFSPRAWARAFCRFAAKSRLMKPMSDALLALFRGRLVADAWDLSPPTDAEIKLALTEIERVDPRAVIVNYAFWGPLLALIDPGKRKRVILMHDLLSARIDKFLRSGFPLDCPLIEEEMELGWLNQADYVLAIQKKEAEYVESRIDATVLVQPLVIPIRMGVGKPDPFRCLFVGTKIRPNISGIGWFLENVWPLVLQGNKSAQLAIAGSVCGAVAGDHPNVRLLGVVPSLESEIDQAGVCIVPLLVGSGLKIKLLEALASGKACVSTPIGVQGIEDWAHGAIDVASDPGEFARAILRLMSDDELRASRERAAHELIRHHFSSDSPPARAFAARVLGDEDTGLEAKPNSRV
jgi:glycosyltransferase involved in cell wall biosynthesis